MRTLSSVAQTKTGAPLNTTILTFPAGVDGFRRAAPQPVTPALLYLVLVDRTGPRVDDDADNGDFVREREDLLAAAYWGCDLGEFVLPRAATRRAIVRAAAEIGKSMP